MNIDSKPTPSVFVIEDDPTLRECIVKLLENAGFMVFGFANPDACEAILPSMCPRVIVSDYEIPGFRNGVAFMRDVHRDQPERMQIPFVFVTGHYGDIETDGYPRLRKPFRSPELVEHVNMAVVTMLKRQGIDDDALFDMEIEQDMKWEREEHARRIRSLRASGLL